MALLFTFDDEVDALCIRVSDEIVARTEQLDEGTLVDLDAAGGLVAIEVIRPARAWPLDEILGRFDLDEDDESMLRSFWDGSKPYPFADHGLAVA